jgi:membrane-bound serine protease (ClpP class)
MLQFLCTLSLLSGVFNLQASDESARQGFLAEITGTIGPATVDYLDRALDKAESQAAELMVLRIDTPGGLDISMRAIIKRILAAEVPVIGYVAPSGSRAASAGTYILYASHVAAMAPATNLGAATPVSFGALPDKPLPDSSSEKSDEEQKSQPVDSKQRKVVNDAAAYIRGLAVLRGRNVKWAEQAVRESVSLSAEEALEQGVINLIANDIQTLLEQLHGYQVELPMGSKTLDSKGISLHRLQPDWQTRMLSIISNPNLAYILMLVGIYGLIYEFANPGSFVPGIVGAISLFFALYAFHVLPINYAGFALILLGLSLMVAEAFVPSFGALGIGGVTAFVIGSLILVDTDQMGYGISLPLILSVAIVSAVLLVLTVGMALKSRRSPVVSGREELVNSEGLVVDDFTGYGMVRVHGEIWKAHSEQPMHKDQQIVVTGWQGLVLEVTPASRSK